MRKKDIPDETALSLEAFAESVRKNEPTPGMAMQGLKASVAAILGDEAMVRNEIIDFSREAGI
jgi:hypothetical protein